MKDRYKHFTYEEIKFLYESSGKLTIEEASRALDRSTASVRSKIAYINKVNPAEKIRLKRCLRKDRKSGMSSWREETVCTVPMICSAVYRGESFKQIAADINRPAEQVEYIYKRSLEDGSYEKIKEYQERSYDGKADTAVISRGALRQLAEAGGIGI